MYESEHTHSHHFETGKYAATFLTIWTKDEYNNIQSQWSSNDEFIRLLSIFAFKQTIYQSIIIPILLKLYSF